MNCRRIDLLLSDHLEGFLGARLSRAVTAHLDGCPRCRRRHDQLGAVGAELRRAEALCRPPALLERALESWLSEREAPRPAPRTASGERRATSSISRSSILFSGSRYVNGWAAVTAALLAGAAMIAGSFHVPFSGKETSARHLKVTAATCPGGPQIAQRSPLAPSDAGPRGAVDRQRPERGVKRDEVPAAIVISGRYAADHAPWIRPAPHADRRPGRHTEAQGARGRVIPPPADDLAALNGDPLHADQRWRALPQDEWQQIEQQVRRNIHVRDDFVTIPFPRIASSSDRAIAQAVESYKREAAIVDPRLSREVTCAFKGMALSDICEQLKAETGIQLSAGASVADEKVTLFCEKLPLREVMRQLSRPFGYTWLRSKKEGGEYRYELAQDLRSQLLEEELGNRDRDEALIALDREMSRYRKYLDLSPDEALARARTAPPEEKPLLEHLATDGWGLVQIYFRLSPNEMAALRAGQTLIFSQEPTAGEQPLPADLARGILQSERDNRIFERDGAFRLGDAKDNPDGMLATAVPEARAKLMLRMPQSELCEFRVTGGPGVFISAGSQTPGGFSMIGSAGSLAVGRSPAVLDPNNGAANAPLARDPALHSHVTVVPVPSCQASVAGEPLPNGPAVSDSPTPPKIQNPKSKIERVTSADLLEALHRATGRPIVSDFYTRLYPSPTVTVRNMPLFDTLNRLSDAMGLRWGKDGAWLQFRSTSFFNDRLKEVPNRLLTRWSASRRQRRSATLDDLIEMAQLSDAQLDAVDMMEGAKECWGLAEWDLVHRSSFRPQLRYLAGFTPEQRRLATSPAGLPFTRLTMAQQQQFLSFFLPPNAGQLPSGKELTGAALRVDYSQPGSFEWARPESGWRQFLPPPVREPTRDAALRAALRIDPQATDAQITPTRLGLSFLYTPGGPNVGAVRMVRTDRDGWWGP